ncbi:MAG: ankyrin repeat domain-containing protein [Planctomycetota bacterium]
MSESFELFESLRANHVDQVRSMLERDPELATSRDESGVSLLMHLCYRREFQLAESTLRVLPSIDAFEAAALGRSGDLSAAVERSPGLLTRRSPDGFTVLHLAAFFAHCEDVAWLLKRGAPADAIARNTSIVRPLHSAVAARSARCAEHLLNAGAEVDAIQRGGFTPLHGAAQSGDLDLLELLLSRGADRAIESDDGKRAIDLAVARGQGEAVARLSR